MFELRYAKIRTYGPICLNIVILLRCLFIVKNLNLALYRSPRRSQVVKNSLEYAKYPPLNIEGIVRNVCLDSHLAMYFHWLMVCR